MTDTTLEAVKSGMQTFVGLARLQNDRLEKIDRRLGGGSRDDGAGVGFLAAVRNVVLTNSVSTADARFINAVSTYGNERTSADGGFAVPSQWAPEVERVLFSDSVLGALRPRPLTANMLSIATDGQPPWSASGPTAATVAEGGTITPAKPAMTGVNVPLYKRSALLPITAEAVEDNPTAFLGYANDVLLARVREAGEAWVVAGTGLGEPLGFLNAPARIEVAKDANQTAKTITTSNVARMAARVTRFSDSFWVAHATCLEQVATLGVVYSGSGGPAGSILGRPLYLSESMNELGTAGDIALVDPAGIVFAVRGPRVVDSLDFAFDQQLDTFRANFRLGCAHLLAAAVARKNGTSTASHVVTLALRS